MNIITAQREMRSAFLGGFAGQLVSGNLANWLGQKLANSRAIDNGRLSILVIELAEANDKT